MILERLNPLNDYLFLKMLGEPGNEEQLLSLLKAILKRTGRDGIESVVITESTKLTADIIGDKSSVLDILAVMDDGAHVNIEVQLKRVEAVDKRLLFYWSRDYARAISAGQGYDKLPDMITIVISEFDIVDLPDFHTSFHLREDNNREYILTSAMEVHVVNMKKFRALKEVDVHSNPLHRWLAFLNMETPIETVEEVIRMDGAIQKASERMEFVSQDKEALRLYRMREMAMSDWTSGVSLARKEGRAEGRAEGRMEMARSALIEGADINFVSKFTGLDLETVKRMREELRQ